MKALDQHDFLGASYPTCVIQFGEGSFLRASVDWQLDTFSEQADLSAGATIVCPVDTDFPPSLSTQDGLYTMLIRGLSEQGEAVSETRLVRPMNSEINSYQDFAAYLVLAHNAEIRSVFSNTAGIRTSHHAADRVDDAPPASFPAKLTCLLLEHFNHFADAADKGWVITPCKLIGYNSETLKTLALRYAQEWQFPPAFADWMETVNTFCSALVDCIVTGYPCEEATVPEATLGHHDVFLDTTEHFCLFAIQGPQWLAEELKLTQRPLNIRMVSDIKPYKGRKVTILNDVHTALMPAAWLCGLETIGKVMQDTDVHRSIEQAVSEEIIPVLDLPADKLREFADAVSGCFQNPCIRHQLLSIALNGAAKFRTRVLPQLLAGQYNGRWPARLTLALATLLALYHAERNEERYPIQDDRQWISLYASLWLRAGNNLTLRELVDTVLGDVAHWEEDLTLLPGPVRQVMVNSEMVLAQGTRQVVNGLE